MKMRNIAGATVLALSLGLSSGTGGAEKSDKRPDKYNVLFVAADDLNIDIGCYGNSQVKTPNIDRLARMGMRFDSAYCQQPLCGPSRASIMSGLRPNTTGFVRLEDDLRKLKPDVVTMGQFFQEKGYYVGRVGKIYHYGNPREIGTNGHDDAPTWQERYNPAGIDKQRQSEIVYFPGGAPAGKRPLGCSMSLWDPISADEEHTDGMVASKAIELIDAHKNEPFFIAAGFFNPHCPYVAPKKYFDMYPLEEITLEPKSEASKDLEDVPRMAYQWDRAHWNPYNKVSHEEARKCKRAYYACVSFVDAQVGRLIDALEDRDLLKNTIIVFWSDHGYFLGEKGLWYKRKNFERSVRVPLIFAGPPVARPGSVCSKPVELIDLYPTLADCGGYDVPARLEGASLRRILAGDDSNWDKPAISQVYYSKDAQGFSIRTERWRYTEWNRGKAGRELYDHESDPDEKINLAGRPGYADVIGKLSARLEPFRR